MFLDYTTRKTHFPSDDTTRSTLLRLKKYLFFSLLYSFCFSRQSVLVVGRNTHTKKRRESSSLVVGGGVPNIYNKIDFKEEEEEEEDPERM